MHNASREIPLVGPMWERLGSKFVDCIRTTIERREGRCWCVSPENAFRFGRRWRGREANTRTTLMMTKNRTQITRATSNQKVPLGHVGSNWQWHCYRALLLPSQKRPLDGRMNLRTFRSAAAAPKFADRMMKMTRTGTWHIEIIKRKGGEAHGGKI